MSKVLRKVKNFVKQIEDHDNETILDDQNAVNKENEVIQDNPTVVRYHFSIQLFKLLRPKNSSFESFHRFVEEI